MEEEQKRNHTVELYDIYGNLLTEKQKEYFEEYYFMDLSISEMAENHGISRNGVFDQVKRAVAALEEYEKALHLDEKYKKIDSMEMDATLKESILNLLKE